ncbi:MAG: SagB/ThcOx family dehydrogenase [Bacteroidales bacterium]|nr:SagB/ThcOx family dehydrogenase [Bacteroidales bacterium]
MKHLTWLITLITLIMLSACNNETQKNDVVLTKIEEAPLTYILPSPKTDGKMSVEKALAQRRSHRAYQDKALSAEQLSQILWSAYGITKPVEDNPDRPSSRPSFRGGFRTAPSAGATFPFEIYAIVGNVSGIEPGVYKYISENHKLVRVIDQDVRVELRKAALDQMMVEQAPATVFWSAIFERATVRYGDRGRERYVCMDLGHSGQNVYLQAEAMGLGTCAIGAFTDADVSRVLQLPAEEEPLYMMPVGYIVVRQ